MTRYAIDCAHMTESSGTSDAAGEADAVDPDQSETAHLEEIPDGAGCVEIWERISESRADD